MKGLNEIRSVSCSFLVAMALISLSCVNEEYDLDKEIDGNVTLMRDVALPLGSFEKVTLDKLLDFTDETDMIETDSEGNLAISFADAGKKLTQTVMVPDFSIEEMYESAITEAYVGDFYLGYDSSWSGQNGNFADMSEPRPFPDPVLIEIAFSDDDFPRQIKDIGYAELDALASLNISIRDANKNGLDFKVVLAEGTEIEFPEWVILGEIPSVFSQNGNILTLKEDIPFNVGTSTGQYPQSFDFRIIGFDGNKLPQGQGITADGKLLMDDYITIDGIAWIDTSELGAVSPVKVSPVISTYFEFSEIEIDSIEVLFGNDIDIDLVSGLSPITFDRLPAFLSSKDVVLDLADIRLDVEFENASPFSGSLSTVIESYTDDRVISVKSLGPVHFDAGKADEPAFMRWSFSEGTLMPPYGYVQYDVPGLTELVESLPEYVRFRDFSFDLDKEFAKIVPGERYVFTEQYSIYAPLAFGPDFKLPYTYSIENIGFDFTTAAITSAHLILEVESTVPLDFTADAVILGNDGLAMDGLGVQIADGAILKAGNIDAPVVSELVIELTNSGNSGLSFDGLELSLNASAPEEGIHALNVNQSLHVKSIVIRLPEGVSFDFNEEI